jgi:D-alanine-D-alanine ligase-like ATP-grasp enzyme
MSNLLMSIFCSLITCCFSLKAEMATKPLEVTSKVHVVVAMPYQEGVPYDPNWYSPAYVDYIASLLPAEKYDVTGYFVCHGNIPKFLDDMKALYDKKEKVCVFNVCDGAEWDGYPGISVLTAWEKHPVNGLIPMTGSDSLFIFNSDDKYKMQSFLTKAGLKVFPQALLTTAELGKKKLQENELSGLLTKQALDKSWPLFCKLNVGAGALGIGPSSICNNVSELLHQISEMHALFPKADILIQPYLVGPEYTIFVMNDKVYAAVRRDYHNHFNIMLEDYVLQGSNIDDEITFLPAPQYAQDIGLKAVFAIPGKHHYTRIDMREDGKGNVYVIDINDRPGFGVPSTINYMLEFNHITVNKMMQDLIDSAS